MKHEILTTLLLACISLSANGTVTMSQTRDVEAIIDTSVSKQEPAFVSGCVAHSGPKQYIARVVFFPRKNHGLFVFSSMDGTVLNYGGLDWTDTGRWDMSDLEGGIQTVKILSDLFYKVTRLPFAWAAPENVKETFKVAPKYSCEMLKQ